MFFRCKAEDALHDRCCLRVRNQVILVPWVLPVTVWREGAEKQALCRALPLGAFALLGKLTAVKIVDQRLKRGIQAVNIRLPCTVKSIVDSDEANTQKRKDPADIVADNQIIASKSG